MHEKPACNHHLLAQDHSQGPRTVQAVTEGSEAGTAIEVNEEEDCGELHIL